MAKVKSSIPTKIVFGKRKLGKAKKRFGPKNQSPKRYQGQGR